MGALDSAGRQTPRGWHAMTPAPKEPARASPLEDNSPFSSCFKLPLTDQVSLVSDGSAGSVSMWPNASTGPSKATHTKASNGGGAVKSATPPAMGERQYEPEKEKHRWPGKRPPLSSCLSCARLWRLWKHFPFRYIRRFIYVLKGRSFHSLHEEPNAAL